MPSAAADKVEGETILSNGETKEVVGVRIDAVPMYNNHRGPEEGKLYHDKGRGNGYILTLGGKRVYFSGDTACVPEIKALEKHRRGLHDHEPPLHDAPRGGGGMRASIRAEDRLSVPLSRLRSERFRLGAEGQVKH